MSPSYAARGSSPLTASPESESTTTQAQEQEPPASNAQAQAELEEVVEAELEASAGDGGGSLMARIRAAIPELFDQLQDVLTWENIEPHLEPAVESALESASKAASDALSGLNDQSVLGVQVSVEREAARALLEEITPLIEGAVDSFLAAHGETLVEKLAGWTEANPGKVAALAIFAGLGYAFHQLTTDELAVRIPAGRRTQIDLAASLGVLKDEVADMARVRVEHEADGLMLAAQVEYSDGTTTLEASGEIGVVEFETEARVGSDGLELASIGASAEGERLSGGASVEHTPERTLSQAEVRFDGGETEVAAVVRHDSDSGETAVRSELVRELAEGVQSSQSATLRTGGENPGMDYRHELTTESEGLSTSTSYGRQGHPEGVTHSYQMGAEMDVTEHTSATARLTYTNPYDAPESVLSELGMRYSRDELEGFIESISAQGDLAVREGHEPSTSVSSRAELGMRHGLGAEFEASTSTDAEGRSSRVAGELSHEVSEGEGRIRESELALGLAHETTPDGRSLQGSLSGEAELRRGHTFGGEVVAELLDDPRILRAGAFYGFTDEEDLRSFLIEYTYDADRERQHEIVGALRRRFESDVVRFAELESAFATGTQGTQWRSEGVVGFGSRWESITPVAGMGVSHDPLGTTVGGGVGVQIGDRVRVMGRVDSGPAGVTPGLQISVPFGGGRRRGRR
ncbi:MAG: hypothetical protein EA397_11795 [Deltaproteobacteria bacterium]|nr:MAG: hypothetical protein EA397_11795 [Deltaproteobacteria bacterium]